MKSIWHTGTGRGHFMPLRNRRRLRLQNPAADLEKEGSSRKSKGYLNYSGIRRMAQDGSKKKKDYYIHRHSKTKL